MTISLLIDNDNTSMYVVLLTVIVPLTVFVFRNTPKRASKKETIKLIKFKIKLSSKKFWAKEFIILFVASVLCYSFFYYNEYKIESLTSEIKKRESLPEPNIALSFFSNNLFKNKFEFTQFVNKHFTFNYRTPNGSIISYEEGVEKYGKTNVKEYYKRKTLTEYNSYIDSSVENLVVTVHSWMIDLSLYTKSDFIFRVNQDADYYFNEFDEKEFIEYIDKQESNPLFMFYQVPDGRRLNRKDALVTYGNYFYRYLYEGNIMMVFENFRVNNVKYNMISDIELKNEIKQLEKYELTYITGILILFYIFRLLINLIIISFKTLKKTAKP